MSSYNRMKAADRVRERKDRQAELDAIGAHEWPRDLNDEMRWTRPSDFNGPFWAKGYAISHAAHWAVLMCREEIAYLNGVDDRIRRGDPDLRGWELAVCPHCQNTGWMPAFGMSVPCTRHTSHDSHWLRYLSGRLADGETEPAAWMKTQMGETA